MTYDPVAYWTERGRTYEATFTAASYSAQEAALASVLAELPYTSVLEVGCGFGRIGELVRTIRPEATYTAIDMSATMVDAARRRLGDDVVLTSLADFHPATRWDLVLAVEVLMHIPPGDFPAAVRRLFALSSRHVVTVDWTEPIGRPAMAHNFRHDYSVLPGTVRRIPVGLQTIHVVSR